jgi:hypothetical protein
MIQPKQILALALLAGIFTFPACSEKPDSHTTVTTYVPPPPHQTLTIVSKPVSPARVEPTTESRDPVMTINLENGKTFRVGEEVPLEVLLSNAKLKGEDGEFRVRYIVDDEEMRWIDKPEVLSLSGWTPGKHTIRVELIGPDGWPYMNGAHVVTKEISVVP